MKKVASIAMIALLAVSFTSCKKDWTCECKDENGEVDNYPIKDVKKADAKKSCDATSSLYTLVGGSCSLK